MIFVLILSALLFSPLFLQAMEQDSLARYGRLDTKLSSLSDRSSMHVVSVYPVIKTTEDGEATEDREEKENEAQSEEQAFFDTLTSTQRQLLSTFPQEDRERAVQAIKERGLLNNENLDSQHLCFKALLSQMGLFYRKEEVTYHKIAKRYSCYSKWLKPFTAFPVITVAGILGKIVFEGPCWQLFGQ